MSLIPLLEVGGRDVTTVSMCFTLDSPDLSVHCVAVEDWNLLKDLQGRRSEVAVE